MVTAKRTRRLSVTDTFPAYRINCRRLSDRQRWTSWLRTGSMNWTKFFIAFVVAWVWIFVFGWVYHGMLLHNTYAAMPGLMRAQADVQFPLIIAGQIVMA